MPWAETRVEHYAGTRANEKKYASWLLQEHGRKGECGAKRQLFHMILCRQISERKTGHYSNGAGTGTPP